LSALEEQLASLQEAPLVALNDVNTRGVLLEDHLRAMPARVRMVALRRVRHGIALALAMVQLCSGHDLCLLESSFLVGIDKEEQEELTGDLPPPRTTEAIVVATYAGDVILAGFFEPQIASRVIPILMKG
jgi:hypothetical protein